LDGQGGLGTIAFLNFRARREVTVQPGFIQALAGSQEDILGYLCLPRIKNEKRKSGHEAKTST
jgi:hypothetical protein